MSDDIPRKNATLRVLVQVPLQLDPEEGAFGTTLFGLPEATQIQVHDVTRISDTKYWATVSMVTDSAFDLAELEGLIDEPPAPVPPTVELPPATQISEAREKRTAARKAKKDPPPTG